MSQSFIESICKWAGILAFSALAIVAAAVLLFHVAIALLAMLAWALKQLAGIIAFIIFVGFILGVLYIIAKAIVGKDDDEYEPRKKERDDGNQT